MSLTENKRSFLKLLLPTINELFISTGNLTRISNNPICDVEVFIRDQVLINKKTFSISKFKFAIEKLDAHALLLHLDDINIPISRIYKKAQINPLMLNAFELEIHKLILDGDIVSFSDFLLYWLLVDLTLFSGIIHLILGRGGINTLECEWR